MPTEQVYLALLVALVVTILAVLHWNRGSMWDLKAVDEPLVAGGGALVIALGWPNPLWIVAGFMLILTATVSRYNERYDISDKVFFG